MRNGYAKQEQDNKALAILEELLDLASPGGWIWPFIELGPPMADLLTRLKHQGVASDYIDRILTSFPDFGFESEFPTPIPNPKSETLAPALPGGRTLALAGNARGAGVQNLVEPLTNRELDVLELLAQRLSNQEIAQQLVISSETVRKHNVSIYQKLGAKSRREAAAKAKAMGILPDG